MSVLTNVEKRIETTDWEEAQYKIGNRVGKYADPEMEQKILQQKLGDALNLDDAELRPYEIEKQGVTADDGDEDAEERELRELRAKRLAEMQGDQANRKITFGTFKHITKDYYIDEVTRAPRDCWVVLLLMKPGHAQCTKLADTFSTLSKQFPEVKFLSIIGSECIPNFPDKHLPSTLIYRNGKMEKNINGLNEWGGPKFHIKDVIYMLNKWGVVVADIDSEDSEDED